MLGPKQVEWCDEKLCAGRFREFREQAERAASTKDERPARPVEIFAASVAVLHEERV